MDKRGRSVTIALVSVLILFSMLVPIYWAVSNGYPDGLDAVLEQQNVEGKGPAYSPPFADLHDYGSTMQLYLMSGVIGAIAVLGILLLVGKIIKRNRREDNL